MSADTPTPRTDAASGYVLGYNGGPAGTSTHATTEVAPAAFARTLERELAAEVKRGLAYECEAEKAIAEATARAERAEAESAGADKRASQADWSAEFCKQWYACRVRRLDDWVRANMAGIPESLVNEYFSIKANGAATPDECCEYASQLNRMEHRASTAEARVCELEAELEIRTRQRDRWQSERQNMFNRVRGLEAEVKRHREQICAERQHTKCARCGSDRHTPLRRDHMGGYVCLTCIDKELDSLTAELARKGEALLWAQRALLRVTEWVAFPPHMSRQEPPWHAIECAARRAVADANESALAKPAASTPPGWNHTGTGLKLTVEEAHADAMLAERAKKGTP
jgi:hypothetical protein